MVRYRITTTEAAEDAVEQTWVLLPDEPSAITQAETHAQREKHLRVRVYREEVPGDTELIRDFPAKI